MLTVNVLLVVTAAAVVKAQGMGPGKGEFNLHGDVKMCPT